MRHGEKEIAQRIITLAGRLLLLYGVARSRIIVENGVMQRTSSSSFYIINTSTSRAHRA